MGSWNAPVNLIDWNPLNKHRPHALSREQRETLKRWSSSEESRKEEWVRLNEMDDLVLILHWLFWGRAFSSVTFLFFILWLYYLLLMVCKQSISGCSVWTEGKLREMKMCSYCAPFLHYITRSRCIPTVILTHIRTSAWTVGLCGAVVMRYVGSWGVKSSSGLQQRQQRDHHLGAKLSLISPSLNMLSHWRWTALLLYLKTHVNSITHTHAHTSINTKCTHTHTHNIVVPLHIITSVRRAHWAVCCWSRYDPEVPFTRLPSFITISTATTH